MCLKFKKTFLFFSALLLFSCPLLAQAYNVSGVVEFSYRNYESKVGSSQTSENVFIQTYRANLQDYLFDPRFLQFNAGIGYSVYNQQQDSSIFNYSLNATFFPISKINGAIFGNKTTTRVDSTTNIAGYDLTTASYGASLNLELSGFRPNRNNNNNYNNRNNNSGRYRLPLPRISISHIHTDSDSANPTSPIHEKRDDTNGSLSYWFNPSFDFRIDGGIQSYENDVTGSSYDTRSANLASNVKVSKDGELRLLGRITDTKTDNILGYQPNSEIHYYSAVLDFKENNGWKHSYRYDSSGQDQSNLEYETQKAAADVSYKFLPEMHVRAGFNYTTGDLLTKATTTMPEQHSSVKQAEAVAGLAYAKVYPFNAIYNFNFNTNYDFTLGSSKVDSEVAGVQDGSGFHYINQGSLGLSSSGWQKESVNLSYTFMAKRDDSPLSNNIMQQSFRFDFNSRRVRDTLIRAKADYQSQEYSSRASAIFSVGGDTSQLRRSFTYDAGADYTPLTNLTLSVGALRSETKSSSTTLSTLQPISGIEDMQNLYYAAALFNYSFTRNLLYRANLREELSNAQIVDTDIRRHIINMNLDYRFRQIFVNFEYRWRQEDPDNALKNTQQYYFVKLSRPF